MELQSGRVSALSRRTFVKGAAVAVAGASGSLAWPAGAGARSDGERLQTVVPPTPIPGGIQTPTRQIHVWLPGDPAVTLPFSGNTLMGFDVDPSTITDRRGFSAVAYHAGSATGSDGATYNLETDIRAYQGTNIASDGIQRFGKWPSYEWTSTSPVRARTFTISTAGSFSRGCSGRCLSMMTLYTSATTAARRSWTSTTSRSPTRSSS